MGTLVEYATSILSQAERRVEIAAENISNGATPAYKRRIPFSALVNAATPADVSAPRVAAAIDFRPGKFVDSGKASDLALMSDGYFALRLDNSVTYTRQGQFIRDSNGRLVNAQGFALQMANGSDLIIKNANFEVRPDGSVMDGVQNIGRIAVFAPTDPKQLEAEGAGFSSKSASFELVDAPSIRQGGYEASNVTTGDDMVLMMEALRRAESGQRVMNVYDDLMGRVITSFGEAVR